MCEVNTNCCKAVQVVLVRQPYEWERKQRVSGRYSGAWTLDCRAVIKAPWNQEDFCTSLGGFNFSSALFSCCFVSFL